MPLIEIPDLAALDDAQQGLTASLDAAVADLVDLTDVDLSGLTVVPARCDAQGNLVRDDATVLYGDGSGSYFGADGNESTWNYGDGSGSDIDGDSSTWNYGDGSGSYIDGNMSIWNYGDGSGSYIDGDVSIWIYGDGSGSHIDGSASIWNYGDGSGSYVDGSASIWNYGDGSGSYITGRVSMRNNGDGTGTVNGVATAMEPLPPLPRLGASPPLAALQPLAPSCGTLVTLPGGVLFDFGSAELRPEAGAVLDAVAEALGGPLARTSTVTVEGHTDSVSDDAFNLALSQRRADSVVDALVGRGVGAPLEAVGFGETLPVAANEIGGVDNPAGRQLNRRVEILIPPV
ncbi:OmpA family protein [Cellulomonas sp. KRMCY2]|uniref:OmpA family protein n=1 Tax=Cellulomonas sp. KRMCY2 TaxID=1304865 RepID=UPI0026F3D97B|nr:OmpA family protein [Cellulomonas sp. KRMCY2]